MSLANAYARVLRDVPERDVSAYLKKLMAFMKSRGHLSLLPQVVRILEREPSGGNEPVAVVAKESDAKKFAKEIAGARVVVDPRAVGGYTLRTGSTLIDKSFRSALIAIYQKTVS